jgi:hypothetical protein
MDKKPGAHAEAPTGLDPSRDFARQRRFQPCSFADWKGGARVAGIRLHAIPEAVDLGSHSAAVFANVARNAGMSVGFQGCCSVLFADLDGAKHFRLDVSLARYPKQAGHDAIQRYAGKPS